MLVDRIINERGTEVMLNAHSWTWFRFVYICVVKTVNRISLPNSESYLS